jgi:hypothetical protein
MHHFQNERHFAKFYLPKLVIVGLIWISAVTLSSWQEYNELQDPTYNYKLDTGNFLVSVASRVIAKTKHWVIIMQQ